MSTPTSTQVVNKLIERLAGISIANGYHTDIADIESERHQVKLDHTTTLPILHVHNLENQATSVVAGGDRQEERTLRVDAYLAGGAGARQRQDALLDDLYRALYTGEKIKLDRLAVEITTGVVALDDAELGSRIVPIYLPVTITYTSRR
ncbi:hypothetical protein SAMN04487957_10589 [Halomonas shengliensis]|uniref:Uncharacterized protein n=1 Tax=Halomonas shengliensis TaxID=419597 RepID=A0A1H0IEL5_9GAMM|nr:hypothetical protein [Halomonas shengliensis]SDO29776.1 hypothetical protein SAMN04487957_10589 [Halomonas shengliensis]